MEPFTAIAAAAPAIYNLITGATQKRKGQQLLDGLERPIYQRPSDIDNLLSIAKGEYADPRFAGQQAYENRLNQNQANAIQAAGDYGNPMHLLANVLAQGNFGAQNVASMQQQDQKADYAALNQAGQTMAGYKDTEWQMNKFAPYSEKYNEGREMIGAGQYNMATGIQGLSNVAVGLLNQMKPRATRYEAGLAGQQATQNYSSQSSNRAWMDQLAKMLIGQTNEASSVFQGLGVPMTPDYLAYYKNQLGKL